MRVSSIVFDKMKKTNERGCMAVWRLALSPHSKAESESQLALNVKPVHARVLSPPSKTTHVRLTGDSKESVSVHGGLSCLSLCWQLGQTPASRLNIANYSLIHNSCNANCVSRR